MSLNSKLPSPEPELYVKERSCLSPQCSRCFYDRLCTHPCWALGSTKCWFAGDPRTEEPVPRHLSSRRAQPTNMLTLLYDSGHSSHISEPQAFL